MEQYIEEEHQNALERKRDELIKKKKEEKRRPGSDKHFLDHSQNLNNSSYGFGRARKQQGYIRRSQGHPKNVKRPGRRFGRTRVQGQNLCLSSDDNDFIDDGDDDMYFPDDSEITLSKEYKLSFFIVSKVQIERLMLTRV